MNQTAVVLCYGLGDLLGFISDELEQESSITLKEVIQKEHLSDATKLQSAEAILIGPEAEGLIGLVQKIGAVDKLLSILIIARPQQYSAVKTAVQFAPFVGKNTSCISYNTGVNIFPVLSNAILRTRQRRSFSKINISSSFQDLRSAESIRIDYLGSILAQAPIGVILFNEEEKVISINTRAKEIFNLNAVDERTITLSSLFPTSDVANLIRSTKSEKEKEQFSEIRVGDKVLDVTLSVVHDERGQRHHLFLINDITAKKATEYKLQESEERLREALLVASTGTWKIDLKSGVDIRDASLNKILGLDPKETVSHLTDSMQRTHPDDVERIRSAISRAVNELGVYDEECRIIRPDGSIRWIRDRGRVVAGADGYPSYMIGAATDITEHKQKEQELQASEERFRTVFENASVGVAFVDIHGYFLKVNPVYCKLIGYAEEEILNKSFQSITHPDDAPGNLESVGRMLRGEIDSFITEKRYLKKDGSSVWAQLWVSMIKDKWGNPKNFVAIAHDITREKKAFEQLRQSELRFRFLTEAMPQKVWTADPTGFRDYFNQHWMEYTGLTHEELLGWGWKRVIHPDDWPLNEKLWQGAIDTGENFFFENRILRKDGVYRWHLVRGLAHKDEKGNVIKWVGTNTDIHDQKMFAEELEAKVKERTRELHEANETLRQSNDELEQFAYIASHDLQEPLRKIQIFSDRLQSQVYHNLDEQAQTWLDKIQVSAKRMSNLIADILNYSRLKKDRLQFTPVDLNDVLNRAITDLEITIEKQKAVIKSDTLPVIEAVAPQVQQLFFNLLANSLKFASPERDPLIIIDYTGVSRAEVLLHSLDAEKEYIKISFADNGIGFDQASAIHIFEIFERLHTKDRYPGTGIGLALCKRVVTNHSGLIYAEGKKEEGAKFTIILPVRQG